MGVTSSFHVESSSSLAMPTNQKFMDELVSLRGFITTWKDPVDVQNQQVKTELKRLSNLLDYMDINDDNDKLES
ncbi:hypothetical protein Lal_00012552 [Lupinus albus]|nr:hypothetical protein Lal_00012552 [Lupinus albus]